MLSYFGCRKQEKSVNFKESLKLFSKKFRIIGRWY